MNKLLALIFIVSIGLFGFAIYQISQTHQWSSQVLPILEQPSRVIERSWLIQEVNQRHSQVRSMTATVQIQATKDLTVRLSGQMAYQQSQCFRLRTESRFGLELDLGSNEDVFWFWSKRMHPPALYYAAHRDYLKTPLKAPFDPLWMMRCFNFAPVETKNIKVSEFRGQVAVRSMRVNNLGQLVQEIAVIDPIRKLVVGHYLCDEGSRVIVSAEIKNFQEVGGLTVPSTVQFSWYEEKTSMTWVIMDVRVNQEIRADRFGLPRMNRMIDMCTLNLTPAD